MLGMQNQFLLVLLTVFFIPILVPIPISMLSYYHLYANCPVDHSKKCILCYNYQHDKTLIVIQDV